MDYMSVVCRVLIWYVFYVRKSTFIYGRITTYGHSSREVEHSPDYNTLQTAHAISNI